MKLKAKNLEHFLENDDLIEENDELVGGKTKMKTPDGQQRKKDINLYNAPDNKKSDKKPRF